MSGYTGPCSGVGRQTSYGTHCGNMGPPNGLSDPVHVMQSTANGEKADMQVSYNVWNKVMAKQSRFFNMKKRDEFYLNPIFYGFIDFYYTFFTDHLFYFYFL